MLPVQLPACGQICTSLVLASIERRLDMSLDVKLITRSISVAGRRRKEVHVAEGPIARVARSMRGLRGQPDHAHRRALELQIG